MTSGFATALWLLAMAALILWLCRDPKQPNQPTL